MDSSETNGSGACEALGVDGVSLPPPPPLPNSVQRDSGKYSHGFKPIKKKVERVPMARPGLGTKGQRIQLLTNHFKVNVSSVDDHFFHYCVSIFYEDGKPVDAKGIGRKIVDHVKDTYNTELGGKDFAYDGEKSLFTAGALPLKKLEFSVVLEDISSNRINGKGNASPDENDQKRQRRPNRSRSFKVG